MKKLVDKESSFVSIEPNLDLEEFNQRSQDALLMDNKEFASKRNEYYPYNPVKLKIKNEEVTLQMNYCTDPLCKWYGTEQAIMDGLTRDKKKFTLNGSGKKKNIKCHDFPIDSREAPMVGNTSIIYSNWGIATEIKRLIDISSFADEVYLFHKDTCEFKNVKPNKKNIVDKEKKIGKKNGGLFYADEQECNSIKYRCIKCGKYCTVTSNDYDYHLKEDDKKEILRIMDNIITRKAVRGAVATHKIGTQQYYDKIKLFYEKCLQFLEKHETQTFKKKQFDELWLTTDKLDFTPNFQRDNGHGGEYYKINKAKFKTHVINTIDNKSNYVFRSDVAYDFDCDPFEVLEEIKAMFEYKLDPYQRKHGKYNFKNYEGKDNSENETSEAEEELIEEDDDDEDDNPEVDKLENITNSIVKGIVYHRGLYVNPTYTSIAHFWLLNRMIKYNKLNICCDNDNSLKNAITRIFKDRILNKNVNVFATKLNKKIKLKDARKMARSLEYTAKKEIAVINEMNELPKGFRVSPYDYYIEQMMKEIEKGIYHYDPLTGLPKKVIQREHIKPSVEGSRKIFCLNDISYLNKEEIAKLYYKVSDVPLSGYHTELRFNINLLEKGKYSSRKEGLQYQHAPKNIRYVHYLLTIYRVYHNFCKFVGKEENIEGVDTKLTPAMRLGIANVKYELEDILNC
ncbi:MAG: hypothetical protein K0Q49_1507 [Haloplasmataceae bacterium]|jgi:hypothetical protein|nr:hypothetical protein [Haloplasmataceae bacterium]